MSRLHSPLRAQIMRVRVQFVHARYHQKLRAKLKISAATLRAMKQQFRIACFTLLVIGRVFGFFLSFEPDRGQRAMSSTLHLYHNGTVANATADALAATFDMVYGHFNRRCARKIWELRDGTDDGELV